MLTRGDETELLTALHQGVLEQPLWSTFLDRLRVRTGASRASLVFRRGDSRATDMIELASGAPVPPELQDLPARERDRLDPIPYRRLRPGRVYALAEFHDPADAAHAAFSRRFLEPMTIADLRVVRVTEPGGYDGWLTVCSGGRSFDGAASSLLSAVAEHLAISMRTFAAIEQERARHGMSAEVVRRLDFCWFTLDARGRIVEADERGEELLRRSAVLRRGAGGHLVPASHKAERALAEALRAFAGAPARRARAIHLSDTPWLDLLLVPAQAQLLSGSLAPVATAYVHGEARSQADRIAQLGELFGLSRSEAGLAMALSRGQQIAEAAALLGLTVETARYYSKQIYSKTGTRGQADLVRLVLASVAMLG